MNVLHLSSGNLYGGVETVLTTMAGMRHLAPAMGCEFALCFRGRQWDELVAAGVAVHDLGDVRISRPWTARRARRNLRKVLTEVGPDVVVSHSSWSHALFAREARRARARLVAFNHNQATGRHWLERWAKRTPPDLVVANSRFTAGSAGTMFPDVPVAVWHLPVPPPRVAASARREVRAELGTAAGTVVILQVSRLERAKGQAIHLEALGALRDVPGWECWMAGGVQKRGESSYQDELEAIAGEAGISGRVRFLGQRGDVPRLMAAADLFCQPNVAPEPFGLVFVEALHARLPVVTAAFGGAAEIVDESCGVLTPPGDVRALGRALRDLLADPARRRALGAAGPPRAAALCDPARQLAAFEATLRAAAGREPRPARGPSPAPAVGAGALGRAGRPAAIARPGTTPARSSCTRLVPEPSWARSMTGPGAVEGAERPPRPTMGTTRMDDAAPPVCSIVIPTHNSARRIGRPLAALAEQLAEDGSFEVIVVDNASTDATAAAATSDPAVDGLGRRGIVVRVIREGRPGANHARLRGLAEARGEFVCFLDDDVIPEPHFVREAMTAFGDPSAGLLVSRVAADYETAPPPSIRGREHLLAINAKFGERAISWGPRATFAPTITAALWARRRMLAEVIAGVGPDALLSGRAGSSLAFGSEDIELGYLVGRFGFDRVYCPALRVRHVIPASRLRLGYFCRLIIGVVRSEMTLEAKYHAPGRRGGWLGRFANLVGALAAAPLLLLRRDGMREVVFALAARWARLLGPYPPPDAGRRESSAVAGAVRG